MGIGAALKKSSSALIKINLAHLPEPGHPRTDPTLLVQVVRYVTDHKADCAIAEGANGFLQHNIEQVGLRKILEDKCIRLVDLDLEECDRVVVEGEEHYLPRCLREYGVRVGMPVLSKRPGMTFSNNIKLFVGAVPRRMYQVDGIASSPRPRIHLDLHRSVASLYRAIQTYAPFDLFIDGGTAMIEGQGELVLPEILLGDDALELDQHLLQKFGLETPQYIQHLASL